MFYLSKKFVPKQLYIKESYNVSICEQVKNDLSCQMPFESQYRLHLQIQNFQGNLLQNRK